MKSMVVTSAGGGFAAQERPLPDPGPGEVRVKVHACGLCHSDRFVQDGLWPGLAFPRVPGHEVAGVVDAIGPDATSGLAVGDRVLGLTRFGGHAEQVVVPPGVQNALVALCHRASPLSTIVATLIRPCAHSFAKLLVNT